MTAARRSPGCIAPSCPLGRPQRDPPSHSVGAPSNLPTVSQRAHGRRVSGPTPASWPAPFVRSPSHLDTDARALRGARRRDDRPPALRSDGGPCRASSFLQPRALLIREAFSSCLPRPLPEPLRCAIAEHAPGKREPFSRKPPRTLPSRPRPPWRGSSEPARFDGSDVPRNSGAPRTPDHRSRASVRPLGRSRDRGSKVPRTYSSVATGVSRCPLRSALAARPTNLTATPVATSDVAGFVLPRAYSYRRRPVVGVVALDAHRAVGFRPPRVRWQSPSIHHRIGQCPPLEFSELPAHVAHAARIAIACGRLFLSRSATPRLSIDSSPSPRRCIEGAPLRALPRAPNERKTDCPRAFRCVPFGISRRPPSNAPRRLLLRRNLRRPRRIRP